MKGKIFNTQEVQAIIAGNKTQFRQICKKQPEGELEQPYVIRDMGIGIFHYPFGKIPYQVGQKIFCKESFVDFKKNNSDIFYKSDFDINNLVKTADLKWKPAQHMKQEHSRLTLLIKEIRVEKLIPITQEDCVAEGVKFGYEETNWGATKAFKDNWNATHKKPEEKFEANPFVWVVDFKINK